MKATIIDTTHPVSPVVVVVTLSRKNLADLAAQVEEGRETVSLTRLTEEGYRVYVYVEDNDTHYGERTPGPGSGLVKSPTEGSQT